MISNLFSTAAYSSASEKDRARIVYIITMLLLSLFGMYFVFVDFGANGIPLSALLSSDPRALIFLVGLLGLSFATFIGVRRGGLRWASALPIVTWLFAAVIDASNGFGTASDIMALSVTILLGGLLLGRAGVFITFAAVIVLVVIGLARNLPPGAPSPLVDIITQLIIIVLINLFYLRNIRTQRSEASERSLTERARSIRVVDTVAQQIAQRRSTDEVLNNAINQVIEIYPNIYHAQVFLIDENGSEARLRASTGDAGRALLQRRHSLSVGSRSVIGQVTALGEPVIARTDVAESVLRRNEFLPDTAVEMAFPLLIGSRTIGALDLQSKFANGINDEDIPVFQLLANTIAVALDNGELFRLTQDRLRDNQKLIDDLTRSAKEVQTLNEQLTQGAWSRQLESMSGQIGVEVTLEHDANGILSTQATAWNGELTSIIRDAMNENAPLQRPTATGLVVAIPLRVRGLALGALELELPDRAPLSNDEIDLAMNVVDRFGVMIESQRASEDNRRLAQREALVNAISGRLQTSYDIHTLLGEAARGLQGALGVQRIAIRLGTPTEPNGVPALGEIYADERSGS